MLEDGRIILNLLKRIIQIDEVGKIYHHSTTSNAKKPDHSRVRRPFRKG